MSYVVEQWNKGEVKFEGNAIGWRMSDGEFRPLMSDALEQLFDEALIDDSIIEATNAAREIYVERTMNEYRENQKKRTPEQIAEQRFEARAAMGPGVDMVNIITGEKWNTSDPLPTENVETKVPTTNSKRYSNKKEHAAIIIEQIGLSNRKEIIAEMVEAMGVSKANAGVYIYNYKKANNI
jgi:hypothetical protein|tara:strand:- start:1978 stop:2520 length:543 start_codon:yes stop_codon:yes gene_type:complete